ncbi:MAG: helix-turn-helix transcriptional regulator [Planctomycetes bacterium]|nr:helix-turn-helix transcriptional regulator [Planctomycetota bacterium]
MRKFRIPVNGRPEIFKTLLAHHPVDQGNITYRSATNAMHLYLYETEIVIGKERFSIKPGDMTISPAETPSRYFFENDGKHWCVHFHLPADAGRDMVALPLHMHLGEAQPFAIERLRQIVQLHNQPESSERETRLRRMEAANLFQAFILWLARQSEDALLKSGPSHADTGIARMLEHIEEHLEEPLPIGRLCTVAKLSRNYLARRFKTRFGMTVLQYILERRIDRAREMMENTDAPIQAIAARVGLPDLQYFNKRFRRVTGKSPTAFRDSLAG